MQTRIDEVNRLLREQITGVRVVRAFVREEHEAERFGDANDDLTDVAITAGRWQAAMFPTVMLVANVATVGVLWFGGHRVENGDMEVGALTAYISYLMQIVMSVMMATFMLMMVPRAAVCADRITEVLDTESSVVPPTDPVTELPGAAHARARRRHVRLPRCGRARAARGRLRPRGPGETLAIDRLDRRRQVDAGRPGAPAVRRHRRCGPRRRRRRPRHRPRDPLVAASAWCRRRPSCSAGPSPTTCATASPDATEDEMWAALEIAQAKDFVEAMPDGLDAPIAQGGTNVQRRPAPAAGDRPCGDPPARRSTCSTTRSRRSTSPPTRGCGPRCSPVTREATVVIVAQRVGDHPPRRPDRGDGGRRRRRHRHPRRAARRPARPTRRSSQSQLTARGGGMTPTSARSRQGRQTEGDRARPVRPRRAGSRPDGRRDGRPEGRHVLALAQATARAGCAPSAHKAYAVLVADPGQRDRSPRSGRRSSAGRPT